MYRIISTYLYKSYKKYDSINMSIKVYFVNNKWVNSMPNDNPTYRAIEKYKKKTYERIELLVYKGEKQKIKDFAKNKGKSVNGFITDLIRAEIYRESSDSDSDE